MPSKAADEPRCPEAHSRASVAVGFNAPTARLWPAFLQSIQLYLVEPLGAHAFVHVRGKAQELPEAARTVQWAFGSEKLVLRTHVDEPHEHIISDALGANWRPDDPCIFHAEGRGPRGRVPYTYAYLPIKRRGLSNLGYGVNRGLRGLYAQSRLYADMVRCEEAGSADIGSGEKYEWLIWTRADFMWMVEHPALALLTSDHVWIPDCCDHFVGINDQHAAVPRSLASIYFGRFHSLPFLNETFTACGTSAAFEFEQLEHGCIAERYLRCHLRRHHVPVGRFLPVAAVAKAATAADGRKCSDYETAVCPLGRPDCSHFFRDIGDATLAASVAMRIKWGWRWQTVPRTALQIWPLCLSGDEAAHRECCQSAFQQVHGNHFCFGAWDPTYHFAEVNLERCCKEAYSPKLRPSQPVLVVLEEEQRHQLQCLPCGMLGVKGAPQCLYCICGQHRTGVADCAPVDETQPIIATQATVCSGQLSFRFMNLHSTSLALPKASKNRSRH